MDYRRMLGELMLQVNILLSELLIKKMSNIDIKLKLKINSKYNQQMMNAQRSEMQAENESAEDTVKKI